jgi:hypothetical protein
MINMIPARMYSDLLGKPFAEDGRGPDAYDCVGLAMEVARRRGFKLPVYVSDPAELHRQLAAGGVLSEARRLDIPEAGCIALTRMLGDDRHIVTMVDSYRLLHTSKQTGRAVVERILEPIWQRRVLGFYRLEAL